jgi:hypothetical protein
MKDEGRQKKEGREGREHFSFTILDLSFVIEEIPIDPVSYNDK